ncbi:PIG-L family deacetylase [Pelagibacterium sp.]|uniref:PIG-L family deacetylase n=1 Tax=Pelagibacterium sp. TaxID=1967288 RepID=UPI003A94F106
MPLSRSELSHRFAQRRASPRLVALHRALSRLKSTITVLHTGAHPDDEQNAMLAFMRFGLGMRTIIGCSTRGEGGQNTLGPERSGALGVVRTRELEEAAQVIDADVVWFGFGPSDPVHDFGFSKNGHDTLERWQHDLIVERMVLAYRSEKPDIVIPTFLDVPGQHGHHRAMTMAAEEAIALAADDSAFPEHFAQGLAPWTVTKYYLPAWSGGGSTYDDEVPPPAETVKFVAADTDFATGVPFDEIGEWSRLYHASQGMGRWPENPQTEWPLHLRVGPADSGAIIDNLPSCLADIAPGLAPADAAISKAIAAFPNIDEVVAPLALALEIIEAQLDAIPAEHVHRIETMIADLEAAMLATTGVDCVAALDRPLVSQGQAIDLTLTLRGVPDDVAIDLILPDGVSIIAQSPGRYTLEVAPDAPITEPFTQSFSASGANGDACVILTLAIAGRSISRAFGLERPLTIVPAASVSLSPRAVLVATGVPFSDVSVEARIEGAASHLSLSHADGVEFAPTKEGFNLSSAGLPAGRYTLDALLDEAPAFTASAIDYAHIGKNVFLAPARMDILALDLALPKDRRVGYVGGGADNVSLWLKRMGFEVTELDALALSEDLSGFPAIVVGIFAFGLRPDLAASTTALHAYVEAGGNLVTLYHRPWDGWTPDVVPPRFLKIGQPSLRWRVTNPQAPVEIVAANNRVLAGPNPITTRDFDGWNKERGLYFAAEWDEAYTPLLSMSDKGESALAGALLTAEIGKGRHTHTSLVLHHQLDHLVPGAFRIMANLVAGGRM